MDTLIAYAAEQSNKLRDIAAVAARCGMKAVLLIPGRRTADETRRPGQSAALRHSRADVRVVAPGLDGRAIMVAAGSGAGRVRPRRAPPAILDRHLVHGIDATSAYVDAAEELHRQLAGAAAAPHSVFIAVGAGMTAAGLALRPQASGLADARHGRLHSRPRGESSRRRSNATPHARPRGWASRHASAPEDLTLIDDYAAIGYGVLTPSLVDVIRRFARLHGMIIDPVYNAKVVLALFDQIAAGRVPKGATVVYVNTGGSPATYDYAEALADGVDTGQANGAFVTSGGL